MNFELVTLDGIKFQAEAYSVILPTAAGQITVLPGHEPMLSQLVPGIIIVRRNKGDADSKLEHYATYGGVLEIGKNGVRVLVDEATHGDDINVAEAQKAHDAAMRLLSDAKGQVDLDRAQALVQRHGVRLQVAELRHRHARHQ
jgi:F-type H+-transporting ATPase subunit epsilon